MSFRGVSDDCLEIRSDSEQRECSIGRTLGFKVYCFRRILLLVVCICSVVQYGMVLINGVTEADFEDYYDLSDQQGKYLWTALNFGACALSFIPGVIFDRFGPTAAMIIGVAIFDAGAALQLAWGTSMPKWLTTMEGLSFCYVCFGFASTFFNVIGSFVPLLAFEDRHVGKVSACVQVCMSLGMTFQTQIYYRIRNSDGNTVLEYLAYAIVFTNCCGVLMCIVFQACRKILQQAVKTPSQDSLEAPPAAEPLLASLRTANFAYMLVLFNVAVGFSFSFLDCESTMAAEEGVAASRLESVFGVFNALGRISSSVPLDYTRRHPMGGPFAYILVSLVFFTCGILLFALQSPGPTVIQIANILIAYGYGGLLGIVPPALRLFFGPANLGVIYGLLYVGVSVAEPLWTLLFVKPDGCSGAGCYRTYTLSCALGFALTIALTGTMLARDARDARQRQVPDPLLLD